MPSLMHEQLATATKSVDEMNKEKTFNAIHSGYSYYDRRLMINYYIDLFPEDVVSFVLTHQINSRISKWITYLIFS